MCRGKVRSVGEHELEFTHERERPAEWPIAPREPRLPYHEMEADRYSTDVLVRSRELQRRCEVMRRHSAQLRCESDMLRRDLVGLRAEFIRARDWGRSLTLGRKSRSR
jgi:hypothetical protein